MRVRKRAVALVFGGVLVLLGAGAGCGPGTAPAPATSAVAPRNAAAAEYTIGQFNMAGGNMEHGGKGDEAPDALAREIEERGPAFVTLQEACRDWNERLESLLPGYRVVFHPVTRADGAKGRCKHPSDFGNAILLRDDLGFDPATAVPHRLGSPAGYEGREMLCVRSERRGIVVCSAHLSYGGSGARERVRLNEARTAGRILAVEYAGYTRFLGGDLNDDPLSETAGAFYDPGYQRSAHGEFKEAGSPCGNDIKPGYRVSLPQGWIWCRSAPPTHGQGKIDYIFVERRLHLLWTEVTEAAHSDHDAVWAGVEL